MLTPFEQQLYVIPAISTSEPPVHLHQYEAAYIQEELTLDHAYGGRC
jgi:hypothetical protein